MRFSFVTDDKTFRKMSHIVVHDIHLFFVQTMKIIIYIARRDSLDPDVLKTGGIHLSPDEGIPRGRVKLFIQVSSREDFFFLDSY